MLPKIFRKERFLSYYSGLKQENRVEGTHPSDYTSYKKTKNCSEKNPSSFISTAEERVSRSCREKGKTPFILREKGRTGDEKKTLRRKY